jgi:hypothetical protein
MPRAICSSRTSPSQVRTAAAVSRFKPPCSIRTIRAFLSLTFIKSSCASDPSRERAIAFGLGEARKFGQKNFHLHAIALLMAKLPRQANGFVQFFFVDLTGGNAKKLNVA